MILLIREIASEIITQASKFKFHYDSINSNSHVLVAGATGTFKFHYDSINSNGNFCGKRTES